MLRDPSQVNLGRLCRVLMPCPHLPIRSSVPVSFPLARTPGGGSSGASLCQMLFCTLDPKGPEPREAEMHELLCQLILLKAWQEAVGVSHVNESLFPVPRRNIFPSKKQNGSSGVKAQAEEVSNLASRDQVRAELTIPINKRYQKHHWNEKKRAWKDCCDHCRAVFLKRGEKKTKYIGMISNGK